MTKKIRYDVCKLIGIGSMRFDDLKEAFDMAKAMAYYEKEEVILRKLTWDADRRITSTETVLVNAEGKFRYI